MKRQLFTFCIAIWKKRKGNESSHFQKEIFLLTLTHTFSHSFFPMASSHVCGEMRLRLMTSSKISPRAFSNSSSRSNSRILKGKNTVARMVKKNFSALKMRICRHWIDLLLYFTLRSLQRRLTNSQHCGRSKSEVM